MSYTELKHFLKNILDILKDKYVIILTDKEHLDLFNKIFISEIEKVKNEIKYYLEQGELTLRKTYDEVYKATPDFDFEKELLVFSENHKLDIFRNTNQIKIFFGLLEYILDKHTKVGVGYAICYKIIFKIIKEQEKIEIVKQSKIFKNEEKEFIQQKYDQGLDINTIVDHYLDNYRENKLKELQKIENLFNRNFMLKSWYYIDWKIGKPDRKEEI